MHGEILPASRVPNFSATVVCERRWVVAGGGHRRPPLLESLPSLLPVAVHLGRRRFGAAARAGRTLAGGSRLPVQILQTSGGNRPPIPLVELNYQ